MFKLFTCFVNDDFPVGIYRKVSQAVGVVFAKLGRLYCTVLCVDEIFFLVFLLVEFAQCDG